MFKIKAVMTVVDELTVNHLPAVGDTILIKGEAYQVTEVDCAAYQTEIRVEKIHGRVIEAR